MPYHSVWLNQGTVCEHVHSSGQDPVHRPIHHAQPLLSVWIDDIIALIVHFVNRLFDSTRCFSDERLTW